MKKIKFLKIGALSFIAAALFAGSISFAGDKKFPTDAVFRLDGSKGSLYDLMADGGLEKAMDADLTSEIKLITAAQMKAVMASDFDPQVISKMTGLFKDGEKGFDALFAAFEAQLKDGKKITEESIAATLRPLLNGAAALADAKKIGLAPLIVAPVIAIASGRGVTVVIDDTNWFVCYGYKDGVLTTGRNFGVDGKSGKLLDFSDTNYLRDLDAYTTEGKDGAKFWTAMMEVLMEEDGGTVGKLSHDGQNIVTKFATVYVAELRRHRMVKMNPSQHPWENDLLEATMATFFVNHNGGMMVEPGSVRAGNMKLIKGNGQKFFGIGTKGSGIGETRADRRALQTMLTEALEDSSPDQIAAFRKLIDKPEGDIFRGFAEFISNPDKQKLVKSNAQKAIDAFGGIMDSVQKKGPDLLSFMTEKGATGTVIKKKFQIEICGKNFKEESKL